MSAPKPPPKSWAEPGLGVEERAGHCLWRGVYPEVGKGGSAAQEAAIREAIEAARADALREAEKVARGEFPRAKLARWATDEELADACYTYGRHDAADEILRLLGEKAAARDEEEA